MKNILSVIFSFVFILQADIIQDGLDAYNQGDKQKASQLFKKACDGGNATGCFALGVLYANGDGIRQNKQKASQLFKKACDGGDAGGCFNLGVLYANGDGIRQNISYAKELFGLACDKGLNSGCKNYRILNEQGY